jgi:sulfite reductase alpha subunit-like flavoprotein
MLSSARLRSLSTLIAYGTQTGTSREFSLSLSSALTRRGLPTTVLGLEDVTLATLHTHARTGEPVVLVTSVFGRGEPTDNAKVFFSSVMAEKDPNGLKGLRFMVCGLGSMKTHRAYYNVVGRQLDAQLERLGGERIVERGECNDDGDIEAEWAEFEERAAAALATDEKAKMGAVEKAPQTQTQPFAPSLSSSSPFAGRLSSLLPSTATVARARGLCASNPESPRPCFQLSFETSPAIGYRAGDHIAVHPTQPDAVVRLAASSLSDLAAARLVPGDPEYEILSRVVDLCGPPTQRFLRQLSLDLNQGKPVEPGCTVAETLARLAPCSRPSLEQVLECAPRVQPRQYSIASSHLAHPGSVGILFRLFSWLGADHRPRLGLCSSWMASLPEGAQVPVSVRVSDFHLPADQSATPVVFFAGGTGLAPFLGFLEERSALLASGQRLAPAHLFYGVREASDVAADPVLRAALASGALTSLHIATGASPDTLPGVIRGQSATLARVLADGGVFFTCGGAKGFGQAMVSLVKELLPGQDNEGHFNKLLQSNRFLEDVADL